MNWNKCSDLIIKRRCAGGNPLIVAKYPLIVATGILVANYILPAIPFEIRFFGLSNLRFRTMLLICPGVKPLDS
jgi:hypothetical protein